MFLSEAINPVLGIIENMAYFTPEELPINFLEKKEQNLAEDLGVPFLGGIPIVQSIMKGDCRPDANSICGGEHFR
jgi:ATP-binding protein involved in chromosome partitioning